MKLTEKKTSLIVLVILLLVAIISCLTIPEGHEWGDDFAMYLMHARNLAEGKNYADTGYVFNALEPSYAPQNYPPGFPLIIAPLFKLVGLNFLPYKVLILASFLLFLFLSNKLLASYLPPFYTLIITVILVFSPFFWEYRLNILSDIPGALFFVASLLFAKRTVEKDRLVDWILLTISVFLSYLIRPAGLVVLPAVILHFLHRQQKLSGRQVAALIAFALLASSFSLIFKSNSGYISTILSEFRNAGMTEYFEKLLVKIQQYLYFSDRFAVGSHKSTQFNKLYFYMLFASWFVPFCISLWKRPAYLEYTLLFYCAAVLAWPEWHGLRLFIPVFPLMLYYVFLFVHRLKDARVRSLLTGLITCVMGYLFASYYVTHDYLRVVKAGVQEESSQELFDFVKTKLPKDALIMSEKPRALNLFTGRKGIVIPINHLNQLRENINEYQPSYLMLNSSNQKNEYILRFTQDTAKFNRIYKNEDFQLYEIH